MAIRSRTARAVPRVTVSGVIRSLRSACRHFSHLQAGPRRRPHQLVALRNFGRGYRVFYSGERQQRRERVVQIAAVIDADVLGLQGRIPEVRCGPVGRAGGERGRAAARQRGTQATPTKDRDRACLLRAASEHSGSASPCGPRDGECGPAVSDMKHTRVGFSANWGIHLGAVVCCGARLRHEPEWSPSRDDFAAPGRAGGSRALNAPLTMPSAPAACLGQSRPTALTWRPQLVRFGLSDLVRFGLSEVERGGIARV